MNGHRIDYEEDFAGLDSVADRFDFIHHLLVDSQTSGGIDNDEVEVVALGVIDTACGYADGVFHAFLGVDFNAY